MTRLLYFIDNQISRFEAKLISYDKIDDEYHILLDQTAFYAQGGGMQSDKGFLNGQPVLCVYKRKGDVFHVVKEMIDTNIVNGEIDMVHRHLQAVSHSTQHLLAALFEKYFDVQIDSIEYSNGINSMDLIGIKTLDPSMIKKIEDEANKLIEIGSPIETQLILDEQNDQIIRHVNIVCCQDDNTCGCIHVNDISEIRQLKILSWEPKKNWIRIHYVSGSDLLDLLQSYHNILSEQVKLLSRPIEQLNSEIESKLQKQKQTDYDFEQIQKEYYTMLASSLLENKQVIIQDLVNMSTKELQLFASCIQNKIEDTQLAIIYNTEHMIVISKNKELSAQHIFNELRNNFALKGGGTPVLCQGQYQTSALESIISYLQTL